MRVKSRLSAMLVSLCVLLTSTIGVEAASVASADEYYNGFYSTQYFESEIEVDSEIEYTMTIDDLGADVIIERDPAVNFLGLNSFTWTLDANVFHAGSPFWVSSGSAIALTGNSDNLSNTYRLGIIEPGGVIRYISVTGAGSHTFSTTQTGFYNVCILNETSHTITVIGTYSW